MNTHDQKFSYGWVIVAACFLLMFGTVGIVVNCSSIFLKPVSDAMGFSRTSFSFCFTLITLSLVIGSIIVSKLLAKINLRVLMSVSAVIVTLGYIGYSFCTSLPMFYIASVIIGIGASGVTLIPCSVMLTNWFVEKRGLAMGIAFTGSGFGGMIFAQVANALIQHQSWQRAYLILGLCMAVIILPTTLFLVYLSPAHKGTTAYGSQSQKNGSTEVTGISSKAFMKSKAFFLLILSVFFIGIINLGIQSHIPAHLTDRGLEPNFATSMVTLYMAVLVLGKLLLGIILDKKGPIVGTAYACFVYLLAMVALFLVHAPSIAILFAVLFGLCNAMATVLNPFVTSYMVGSKSYASVYAIVNLFFNVGMALGAPLSGAVYDAQGKYDNIFLLYSVLAIFVALGIALAVKWSKGFSTMVD